VTANSKRRQTVQERRAAALTMRRNGASHAAIAAELGYSSANSASKDVHRALEAVVHEAGKQLLDLERERLDALQLVLWPLATAGDVRAARELVRLMERRARLLGLDAAAGAAREAAKADTAKGILGNFMAALQTAHASLPDTDDPAS